MKLAPALLALFLLPAAASALEPTKEERDWLEHILFGREPAKSESPCRRWAKSPKLTLVNASAEQKKATEEVVKYLDGVLAGTPIFKIEIVPGGNPNAANAEIKMHFAAEKELPAVAQKYDAKYAKGNRGVYWTWWSDQNELTRAVVLIANELKGNDLKSMILKQLVQSLGLVHESSAFADSIFFRDGQRETTATVLSNRDRKLVLFYYNHVSPGAHLADVRKQYKSW